MIAWRFDILFRDLLKILVWCPKNVRQGDKIRPYFGVLHTNVMVSVLFTMLETIERMPHHSFPVQESHKSTSRKGPILMTELKSESILLVHVSNGVDR